MNLAASRGIIYILRTKEVARLLGRQEEALEETPAEMRRLEELKAIDAGQRPAETPPR